VIDILRSDIWAAATVFVVVLAAFTELFVIVHGAMGGKQ
jgi:hypothetical protein